MKRRILSVLLCVAMLAALIPAASLTASAAVEGLWTTYRFASEYPMAGDPDGEMIFRPEPGYRYTDEGFTVLGADYTDTTPHMSVMSKEKQDIKKGVYLQFRVDHYSYGGGVGADQWIALTLTTQGKAEPGRVDFGGGWMALLRGQGDGNATAAVFLTDPKAEGFNGTFTPVDTKDLAVPLDGTGREIYTLEITWDGGQYQMKLNGEPLPDGGHNTALLDKLNADGEFHVGIQMQSAVRNGVAAVTILKYGTCEANAATPVGEDSKEPGENILCGVPSVDPHDVPKNTPGILWSPQTVNMKEGFNCAFDPLGDNTWHVKLSDPNFFFYFTAKNSWHYNAEDFPVFGVLLRSFKGVDGTLWYAAGDVLGPTEECAVPFSIYDGRFYGEKDEYVFIPVDLTDMWSGRIHTVRIDSVLPQNDSLDFDVCFAGMFRSVEEAYAYTERWLGFGSEGGDTEAPLYPETEPPYDLLPPDWESLYESIPDEVITEVASAVEDALDTKEGETVDVEDAVEDILKKYGCTGALSGSMLLLIAAAAVTLWRRRA